MGSDYRKIMSAEFVRDHSLPYLLRNHSETSRWPRSRWISAVSASRAWICPHAIRSRSAPWPTAQDDGLCLERSARPARGGAAAAPTFARLGTVVATGSAGVVGRGREGGREAERLLGDPLERVARPHPFRRQRGVGREVGDRVRVADARGAGVEHECGGQGIVAHGHGRDLQRREVLVAELAAGPLDAERRIGHRHRQARQSCRREADLGHARTHAPARPLLRTNPTRAVSSVRETELLTWDPSR